MDFDETRLYYSHQQLHTTNAVTAEGEEEGPPVVPEHEEAQVPVAAMRRHFREFFRNYRLGNHGFVYRNRLLKMYHRQQRNMTSSKWNAHSNPHSKIQVDIAHVGEYDLSLVNYIRNHPAATIPVIENAAVDALRTIVFNADAATGTASSEEGEGEPTQNEVEAPPANEEPLLDDGMSIQVLLVGNIQYTSLRSIQSQHINRLIHCPGIVISTSPVKYRATNLTIRCTRCTDTQIISSDQAGPFGSIRFPQRCASANQDCPMYPYTAVPDESIFVDQQTIKLQETPERVPTGEMPRSVLCAMERSLVDIAPPGTRVSILCIPTLFTTAVGGTSNHKSSSEAAKSVYLRVVGLQKENGSDGNGIAGISFSPAEEEAFRALSRRSDIYDILQRSIAPNIKGSYTVDIKKALTCQLFGGCRKQVNKTSNTVQLRGDINVLLLGDPSMAKSQFLKFISKVAPVGIYTSGKGSSAAGLTASVVRDAKGEFYLEGGAMVLADGGIVCIDEFDKMRPTDRVAIHEAMEQQTISIAKAGITTVLNSRSSVLAAANPVFGRYDDFKSASDNIDLMTTILSRFDMIFLVRDIREEERDRLICQHVMGVHIDHSASSSSTSMNVNSIQGLDANNGDPMDSSAALYNTSEAIADHVLRIATTGFGELNVYAMKKYIQYCKMKCSPRLSEEAGNVLTSSYVKIRDDIRRQAIMAQSARGTSAAGSMHDASNTVIPITVRQLEALVRISESLAKMRIDPSVRIEDVTEALRLFQVSTMAAAQTNDPTSGGGLGAMNREELDRTESVLRSRLSLSGSYMNRQKLLEECIGQGFNAMMVSHILHVMIGRGEVLEKNQGRLLKRIK